MARETVRLDAAERRKRDGILQAAAESGDRARQPGRNLSGAILVTATFGDVDHGWLEGLRRAHYPIERNRVPVHLTLFHQLPPSAEGEVVRRLASAAHYPAPRARLTGIEDLDGGTAFRVESEELEAIREELAEDLYGLLSAQDAAPWRPHITFQNKVAPREAKALQTSLRATFEPRPLVIKGLAAWHYAGGPWQPIRSWSFRG